MKFLTLEGVDGAGKSSHIEYIADAVRTHASNGFHETPLDGLLRAAGRTDLLLAGEALEDAVHSTLRAANDRGYECLLVLDACAPLDAESAAAAASMVEMSGGIFGAVGRCAEVLDALTELPSPSKTGGPP